jgi:hypothetical protein
VSEIQGLCSKYSNIQAAKRQLNAGADGTHLCAPMYVLSIIVAGQASRKRSPGYPGQNGFNVHRRFKLQGFPVTKQGIVLLRCFDFTQHIPKPGVAVEGLPAGDRTALCDELTFS